MSLNTHVNFATLIVTILALALTFPKKVNTLSTLHQGDLLVLSIALFATDCLVFHTKQLFYFTIIMT